jgi:tetratricopeptide (TPR) repeat protein
MLDLGFIFYQDAKYAESERFLILSVDRLNLEFGPWHEKTLTATQFLGNSYSMQGRLGEAVEMLECALSIANECLGMENLTTCSLLVDEAALYLWQGRWDDARLIAEEILPIQRKLLGDENEMTLVTSWFLASIRVNIAYNMGEWDNGTRILEEAVVDLRKYLTQRTAASLYFASGFASAYQLCGKIAECMNLLEDVLPTMREVMGEEHPTTLVSETIFAYALFDMGSRERAIAIMEEMLAKRRRIFGDEDVDTILAEARLEVMRESAKGFDGSADKKEVAE